MLLDLISSESREVEGREREIRNWIRGQANQASRLNPTRQATLSAALSSATSISDPRMSPLTIKHEFYDARLVKLMTSCTKSVKDVPTFSSCIREQTQAEADSLLKSRSPWYMPPPEFEVWSGVREQSYQSDGQLTFAHVPAKGEESRVFRFMLQVAFTSAPAFLPDRSNRENFSDEQPWEFPNIDSFINRSVAMSVGADETRAQILHDMLEFTILQRLFRNILSGKLGDQFPIESLVTLSKTVANTRAFEERGIRTLRWTTQPGNNEKLFALLLQSALGAIVATSGTTESERKVLSSAHRAIESCVNLIQENSAPQTISSEAWRKSCGFDHFKSQASRPATEASQILQELVALAQQTTYARQMRQSLGVSVDDRQAVEVAERGCPPL